MYERQIDAFQSSSTLSDHRATRIPLVLPKALSTSVVVDIVDVVCRAVPAVRSRTRHRWTIVRITAARVDELKELHATAFDLDVLNFSLASTDIALMIRSEAVQCTETSIRVAQ